MKKYVAIVLFLFLGSLQPAKACSVVEIPLRKQFRHAASVFVGKVLKVEEYSLPESERSKVIPENWSSLKVFSKVTFEITNSWKGDLKKTVQLIGVASDVCACSQNVTQYQAGMEYLIFSHENNFITICDARPNGSDWAVADKKRIDRFWFRAWARILPF